MATEKDPSSNIDSQDHYIRLGLKPGSSFDDVQKARDKLLEEAGDDPLVKAKIEASYDALLMGSLKARQLGTVSNEAATASKREDLGKSQKLGVFSSFVPRFLVSNPSSKQVDNNPIFSFPEQQPLLLRTSFGILAVVLLLTSPDQSVELILSLSTISLFVIQIRNGRRLLNALGWSVVILSIGLIIGNLLTSTTTVMPITTSSFSVDKLQALPAVVLLWIAAIFLA